VARVRALVVAEGGNGAQQDTGLGEVSGVTMGEGIEDERGLGMLWLLKVERVERVEAGERGGRWRDGWEAREGMRPNAEAATWLGRVSAEGRSEAVRRGKERL
jgi:hypothetical protein